MVLAHVHDRLKAVVSDLTIQAFKDDWATRVGVAAANSRSGVHFVPGASLGGGGSGGSSPFTIGGGAAVLTRAGNVTGAGYPTPPRPLHPAYAPGHSNANQGRTPSPSNRLGTTSQAKPVSKPTHGVIDMGGGGGGGGFDAGSWLGNTSTPLKEDSPLPLDLKPPSDISHIVGVAGGGGEGASGGGRSGGGGGGMMMGGTREASRPNAHQQLFFPTQGISPIKKT